MHYNQILKQLFQFNLTLLIKFNFYFYRGLETVLSVRSYLQKQNQIQNNIPAASLLSASTATSTSTAIVPYTGGGKNNVEVIMPVKR